MRTCDHPRKRGPSVAGWLGTGPRPAARQCCAPMRSKNAAGGLHDNRPALDCSELIGRGLREGARHRAGCLCMRRPVAETVADQLLGRPQAADYDVAHPRLAGLHLLQPRPRGRGQPMMPRQSVLPTGGMLPASAAGSSWACCAPAARPPQCRRCSLRKGQSSGSRDQGLCCLTASHDATWSTCSAQTFAQQGEGLQGAPPPPPGVLKKRT